MLKKTKSTKKDSKSNNKRVKGCSMTPKAGFKRGTRYSNGGKLD